MAMHPHESLIRTHVEGEGSERERQEVAEHLKGCSDCREFLSFVQDFSETAKDLAEGEIAADEPQRCVLIDANADAGAVAASVWAALHERFFAASADTVASPA